MNTTLRKHADEIIREAIAAVQPDAAVRRALEDRDFPGRVLLVAAGKAAWQMAKAASDCLGDRIEKGVVVTKYGHVMGPIANFDCFEAGHPVPDENSFKGTQSALDSVAGLTEEDTVLFLLSGGGSALFEKPLVEASELQDVTNQLLACGADIVEINTIRKRLSAVKGGRFAQVSAPARVEAVFLSDILGDPMYMIDSGPACPDSSTAEDARRIAAKYELRLSEQARALLDVET
ncbi:MAG: glycerate-2-kinase family protein, partial [Clostridia bacterium]|nr:glycerate-2-kinase family protein [Clostridia bacterium]